MSAKRQPRVEPSARSFIEIVGARENNLKNVSLKIPKRSITIFTGVSGSGKSSLVFDTIAAEAQRELNETYTSFVRNRLPKLGQPDVDAIENLSPAIVIEQRRIGGNSRSTVGTITDIYALLRLLYSRVGEPQIGEATAFSFNDPAGMCPTCTGIGRVVQPAPASFVDLERSLEDGAVLLPGFARGQYWYRQYADRGLFDPTVPLRAWSADARTALIHGGDALARLGRPVPADYQSLVERFTRIYLRTEDELSARKQAVIDRFTTSEPCPECGGARLNARARQVRVAGRTIVECAALEVAELAAAMARLDAPVATPVIRSLVERLDALAGIGLGYLSLGRATATLSGGESQRIKMVRHLGSSLTEMVYVFDEPSVGLHPHDVERLNAMLRRLRDKGNTVLVVEHDRQVIEIADHVVDLGPGAGEHGGQIVFEGSVAELARAGTLTGQHLRADVPLKTAPRAPTGALTIANATVHNLKDLTVDVPTGVLTVVTGVAGSGKSSLIHHAFLAQHPDAIVIDQAAVGTSRRSNAASYTGMLDRIRQLFARANQVSASLFSANAEGACPACRGLGTIHIDLAYMEAIKAVCEACGGRRFKPEVLRYTLRGHTISDVLAMTAEDAQTVFPEPELAAVLHALIDVGLGYLTLGQPTSTLSGGEAQRLKLATELHKAGAVYVLDEPTTGLHMSDVAHLLAILERLVDHGNTVIAIEHNLEVIRRADWILDLGPGAGRSGGELLFEGPPAQLRSATRSITARYLRSH